MDYSISIFLKIITNRFLLVPVGAMLAAQCCKIVYYSIRGHRFSLMDALFSSGRMPSSHSAFVCSLATVIGFNAGFDSALFAFASIFAFVTMYDAAGVRLQAGRQAQLLNVIVERIKDKHSITPIKLKEFIGHKPMEVYAGAILGVIIGIIFRG